MPPSLSYSSERRTRQKMLRHKLALHADMRDFKVLSAQPLRCKPLHQSYTGVAQHLRFG